MEFQKSFDSTPEKNVTIDSDKSPESKKKSRNRRPRNFRAPIGANPEQAVAPKKREDGRRLADLIIGENKKVDTVGQLPKLKKQTNEAPKLPSGPKMPDTPELRELQDQVRSALEEPIASESETRMNGVEAEENTTDVAEVDASETIHTGERPKDVEAYYGGESVILEGVIFSRSDEVNTDSNIPEYESPVEPLVVEHFDQPENALDEAQAVNSIKRELTPAEIVEATKPVDNQLSVTPATSPNMASAATGNTPPIPSTANVAPTVPPIIPVQSRQVGNTPPPQGPNPPYGARSPWNPNFQPPVISAANVLPTTSVSNGNVLTKKDVDDAEYRGRKRGVGQGVATGLLVGGAYEHFKHKRREKKQEKRFKQQQKKLEQTQTDHKFDLQKQAQQNSEVQRQLQSVQRAEKPVQPNSPHPAVPSSGERSQTAPRFIHSQEKETVPKPFAVHEKTSVTTVEQLQHIQPGQAEQLIIAEGHHLEQSAWHSIEVDNKTGKAVERPAFSYGQEYYHERAQELRPVDQNSPAAHKTAVAAIGATLSSQSSAQSVSNSSQAVGNHPSVEQRVSQTKKLKSKARQGAKKAVQQATTPGSVIPMVIVLVVLVIFILVLI